MSEQQFDWASSASVALREQPAVAVYPNDYGHVVLRRERSWDEEEDSVVLIAKTNVLTLVRAILVVAGMGDAKLYRDIGGNDLCGACEDIEWPEDQFVSAEQHVGDADHRSEQPKAKDRTAAERQRRHRANKPKPDRDTVTVTAPERDSERDAPRLELVG